MVNHCFQQQTLHPAYLARGSFDLIIRERFDASPSINELLLCLQVACRKALNSLVLIKDLACKEQCSGSYKLKDKGGLQVSHSWGMNVWRRRSLRASLLRTLSEWIWGGWGRAYSLGSEWYEEESMMNLQVPFLIASWISWERWLNVFTLLCTW